MRFVEKEILTKDGQKVILRNAQIKYSAALIKYLKVTAGETPYLMRAPEEINITLLQEESFIRRIEESEKELMLIAMTAEGKHIGNCSMNSMGPYKRYRHRCGIAIALYQEYCGQGIGRQMMEAVLEQARLCGYEQAELEVVASNTNAVSLYTSLGFEIYGTMRNNMKYSDGSYQDTFHAV